MACERCAEREHEVLWLRAQLALDEDARSLARLQKAFDIWPSMAGALLVLFNRKGRVTSYSLLAELMGWEGENPYRMATITVHRLRLRFGWHLIETVRGGGYRLSTAGVSRVEACLSASSS